MKRALLLLLALLLVGCPADPEPEPPKRPELGPIIFDRVGRAAVNTALIGTLLPTGDKQLAQDRYNTAAPEDWPSYGVTIGANLAVYDALDATCGNQLLAGAASTSDRYSTLAGALADDRLYVNTGSGDCTLYFGVELNATGAAPNDDCGGRTLQYDVIDVTYSALAIGAVFGVGDGVPADDENHMDELPFFAPAP